MYSSSFQKSKANAAQKSGGHYSSVCDLQHAGAPSSTIVTAANGDHYLQQHEHSKMYLEQDLRPSK